MTNSTKIIAAVSWMNLVWWAYAYLTKDIPLSHWVSLPAYATALTLSCGGAALIAFWKEPT